MPNITQGNLMTRAAFARHMGVTNGSVSNRIKDGTVVIDKKTNMVKVAESRARWAERPNPVLGRQNPDPRADTMGTPAPGSLTAARTKHEEVKRQATELRLRKARGELIDRDRAMETVFALARATRDSFLSWPARYAAIIAAKLNTDPHTTEIILDQCIKAHLRELAEPRVTL